MVKARVEIYIDGSYSHTLKFGSKEGAIRFTMFLNNSEAAKSRLRRGLLVF